MSFFYVLVEGVDFVSIEDGRKRRIGFCSSFYVQCDRVEEISTEMIGELLERQAKAGLQARMSTWRPSACWIVEVRQVGGLKEGDLGMTLFPSGILDSLFLRIRNGFYCKTGRALYLKDGCTKNPAHATTTSEPPT